MEANVKTNIYFAIRGTASDDSRRQKARLACKEVQID